MRLRPIPVTHPAHVESMRRMRNRCAAGFATFNGQISEDEQTTWWAANKDRVRAWLYADDAQSTKVATFIVGFGLIRQHDDGRWFTTVGVLSEATGHDYGKEITHHLIAQVPGKCWGIARRDNPAAVKLHVARDWQALDGPDPALVYFRTWREGSLEPQVTASTPIDCRIDTWAGRPAEPWPGVDGSKLSSQQDHANCEHTAEEYEHHDSIVAGPISVAHDTSVTEPWPPEGAVEEWSEAGWVSQ